MSMGGPKSKGNAGWSFPKAKIAYAFWCSRCSMKHAPGVHQQRVQAVRET